MATMLVETGKIREYARATGCAHPHYFREHRSPIPPTFLSTVVFWQNLFDELGSSGVREALAAAGIEYDARSMLSLGQEYVFHGPLPHSGDTLQTELRFDGIEHKQSTRGRMTLVRFAVLFLRPDRTLTAECLYTSAYFADVVEEQ